MTAEKSDFCVEIEDVEANNLLNDASGKVKDQNNRLMEAYKRTQQSCKRCEMKVVHFLNSLFWFG
jgi:hypothetical protein